MALGDGLIRTQKCKSPVQVEVPRKGRLVSRHHLSSVLLWPSSPQALYASTRPRLYSSTPISHATIHRSFFSSNPPRGSTA